VVGTDIDTAGALQVAIEASPSGVLVVDPEGRIVLVNRGLERQFGYAREELVGQVVELLLPETLRSIQAVHRDGFVRAPGSGPMAAGRGLVARRKDGSQFPVEIELNPFRTPNGLFVLASIVDVTDRRRSEEAHSGALEVEHVDQRREARERSGLTRVVGRSAPLRRVLEQIEQVASTDATVLLLGETGTGKELFATQIHELGVRHSRPMVRVNCAAIPATLIESELFGREKGAYTGALSRQVGRFELAHHSTIFLDEIGDLPPDVQVKLLRVLEERQVERLGSPRPITVDTRVIAATHRNLEQRISEGAFREDLYYRLNVFPIYVPPLRERVEDIPLLVWRFVEEFSKAFGKLVDSIDKHDLTALQRYSWPGNIRELRNVVERAMIVSTDQHLTIPLPQSSAATRRSLRLVDVEKEHIRGVLESTAWRIRGTGGAAERLGLKPTTLETRMAKLGITRPTHH
jgi:formate hydrogenlyase transcriptional activator